MASKLRITASPHGDETEVQYDNVDFLSFINGDTYGKPPIIAPGTDNYETGPTKVVFVNPDKVSVLHVEKYEA